MINQFHCSKVGIEIEQSKVDFLRTRTDAQVMQGDILELVPRPIYDTVLMTEVIEHLGYSNIDKAISVVAGFVKPGGKALISTPDMGHPLGYAIERILHGPIHPSLMFGSDLIARCKKVGLYFIDSKHWLWDTAYLFVKE
jgi:2-polyprenyl-3-methyl-5-hydroxy-6-metoxy-1,4-benzoquinol methylase